MKRLFLILATALSLTSCLDKYPDDAIPAGEAVQTVDDADQLVIGIYSAFKSASLYSGLLTVLPDLQCDLVYAVNGYSNTYGDIWRNEILATNSEVTAVYAQLYGIIGQCNFALEQFDKIKPTIKDDEKLDKLDQLYGEVYFARALCYSELAKLYCKAYDSKEQAEQDLGVVLRSKYSEPEPLKRASLQATYDFVLADLDRAEELLRLEDDFEGVLFSTTFFNEYTVHALRARVLLYMHRYEEAIAAASKVIDSDYYRLAAANELYTSTESFFQYMWSDDDAFEIIWKVGFTTESYGGALGRVFLNEMYLGPGYSTYLPDYVPAQWALNLYGSGDLRPMAYFYTTATGHTHGLTWPLLYKYHGNTVFRALNIFQVNMPKPFRMAEQYLIRAEAYANLPTPNYQRAAKDIATLRKARYQSYNGTPAMGDRKTAMKVIEEERVKELFMEGFRLTDLKRWHKGFQRTPQAETLTNGNTLKVEADDPRLTWPIPQHELESPDADIQPNASNK